jgi:hypothetical protein
MNGVNITTKHKQMKHTLLTLTLLSTLALASAQEKLSREETLRYAFVVAGDLKQLQATPIPTDVDVKQPVAVRDGDFGGMVLPEAKLNADTIAKAGEKVVPIGQVWFLKLTPMKDGEAVAASKLRMVTLTYEGDQVKVSQYALGVQRNGAGALELLVFGKDKEPVVKVLLKTMDAKQDVPIDLSAERESDSGKVTLNILGKYTATFAVTQLED